jgi:hypothetical protein
MAIGIAPKSRRQRALFDLLASRRIYSDKRCFFCGQALRSNRTREHVFPKWLQQKFALANQTLTLLNKTTIRYGQLTVPCCQPCNNVHLSILENKVKKLLFESSLAAAKRDLDAIYLWATKILLGVVYAERLLPFNRRHPKGRRIWPQEMRDALRMNHLFVQRLRYPIKFTAEGKERVPGSVFLFDLKSPKDIKRQFDFRDAIFTLCIFMRLGTRGILAVADGGAVDIAIGELLRRDGKRKLHPLQFLEIGAKTFYKAGLLNRTPKYIIVESKGALEVMQMPLAGLSAKPVFDEWQHPIYAHVLSHFTGYPLEKIASPDGTKVMQWFVGPDGKPLNIPMKE